MFVQVFHAQTEDEIARGINFKPSTEQVQAAWDGEHDDVFYTEVAHVEAMNLDDAFILTNSIRQFWAGNAGVTSLPAAGERCRGTTLGDVMVSEGRAVYVDHDGYVQIK